MTILLIICLTAVGFFTIYSSVLVLFGFVYKNRMNVVKAKPDVTEQKQFRFAIIIPAHNEERVIEQTAANLLAVDYPKELFQVFVVADNCTDETFLRASRAGAIVFERESKEFRGKGYALRWCFELLLKSRRNFNAFLVIDADTIVSKNILEVLNTYLNNGSQVIQCADLVEPKPGAWSSEITRVGLYLYNYARPLGRKMLNCSAGLRGNGMCFDVDVLRKNPWLAYSQTEDLEYGLNLLLKGITVTFAPEAKVFASMPSKPQNAESQRARWELGRFPIIKKYSLLLLKEALGKKSFKIFDAFVELITPAFTNLFLITAVMLLATWLITYAGILSSNFFLIMWILFLALQIFYVLGGLFLARADASAYKALLNAPKFALWKLILYFKLMTKGHTKAWIRTAREDAAN
ncbi:MAG: glycosyltransferase family 2 protein [Bacteroidota bacterium]